MVGEGRGKLAAVLLAVDLHAHGHRPLFPPLGGELRVGVRVVVVVVVPDQDAPLTVETVRRVPDVGDVLVGLGDAAVDPVIQFPPAGLVLQADLRGGRRGDRLQCGLDAGAEVVRDLGEDVGRQRADAVVGLDHPRTAALGVRDRNTAPLVGDVRDGRPCTDAVRADRPGEGLRYLVHAADRLEHQHGLVEAEFEGEVAADPAGEDLGGAGYVPERHTRSARGGRNGRVPAEVAPLVGHLVPQVSPPLEELDELLLVGGRQLLVQGSLVGGLGEQLRDIAVDIGLGGAVALRLGHAGGLVVDVRVRVDVGEHLDRDAQFTAVVKRDHPLRDPRGTAVHVVPVGETGGLPVAVEVGRRVTAPDGEVAPTGTVPGLQDRTVVAGLAEFVRRGQPGDTTPEDDHLGRAAPGEREVAAAQRPERLLPLSRLRGGGEPESPHGREHGPRAPGETHVPQKSTTALVPAHGPAPLPDHE